MAEMQTLEITLKPGEVFSIGDYLILYLDNRRNNARRCVIGVQAPPEVGIYRGESARRPKGVSHEPGK